MINLELRQGILASLSDLEAGDLVLVGLSGGADSLALLKCALHVGNERTISVGAVIIDHQIQDESAKTSNRVAGIARELGADPVLVVNVEVQSGAGSGGMEAAARNARRTAFTNVLTEHKAKSILLGHTLEDQGETVLLGLARGSGARSLSGMRAKEGIYRRPFLGISRELVRAEVSDLDIFEDPHNSDLKYSRVRVRNLVLPLMETQLGPGVTQALARSADLLRDDADALDALARFEITRVGDDVNLLGALPRAIRTRVIRQLAITNGCTINDLTRDHVLAIDALLTNWHGQGALNLPGAVSVERRHDRLNFTKDK
ncbi:MAG: tRNA lysidine(34) synthetase TilS [Actinomycetes bacterium]